MQGDFVQAELVKREQLTHDTLMFGFSSKHDIQVDPGDHFIFKVEKSVENLERKYTPILSEKHYFEVPIKIYPLGQMTQYLYTMNMNQPIKIYKQTGKIKYFGGNKFLLLSKFHSKFNTLLLICGGTGITPAYALIKQMLGLQDSLKIHLLYANKTERDILLQNELRKYQKDFSHRFSYQDILNEQPDYYGLKGLVTGDVIKQVFPPPDNYTLAAHCGPKLMNQLVSKELKQLGYKHIQKI